MNGPGIVAPAAAAAERPSAAENARREALCALARLGAADRAELLAAAPARADDTLAERQSARWMAGRWLRRWAELAAWEEVQAAAAVPPWRLRRQGQPMAHLDDRQFVLVAHEALLRRGCQRDELERWTVELQTGRTSRTAMLSRLTGEQRRQRQQDAERAQPGELAFHVMGTGERVTEAAWRQRCRQRLSGAPAQAATAPGRPPELPAGLRISAITSLYRGGGHIERYLANMAEQTCFAGHLELVIIDAASPDGEQALIEAWARRHDNIRYVRLPHRVGIYEAWNLALRVASGSLLTSANVDDLRRADSVELQAREFTLDDTVDVVYQDFFYTLDPDLPFDDIVRVGYRSELPEVSAAQLMRFNPPHNAPMWRRQLHDELGLFDETLQSAGDYDFWMRCALAGKRFRKCAEAHVAYFHNPEGLSTRPDTRGHAETREVHRRYARHIHAGDSC
jgi:hypothetical protein